MVNLNFPEHILDGKLQPPTHKLSKLSHLLAESKWKHIRYPRMFLDLTDFQFFPTEMEALSFRLKL